MYVGDPRQSAGFPFCPGKATWDSSVVNMFRTLTITAETGALYDDGGIADQPHWYVTMMAWFLPRYNDHKFAARARSILGDGKSAGKAESLKRKNGRR